MAQNVGAKLHDRVKAFVDYCFQIGVYFLGTFAMLCLVFPGAILTLFRVKDPTLVPLSISTLRIMAFVPLMSYTTSIFIRYFQAYNNTKLPFILTSLAQWLFYAPMLSLLLMVLSVSPSTAFWVSSANTFLVLVLHWYYY